ncbi:MAG: MFS transporter [Firmicutes bacterium]|nr:MFS transporter [Alicyclobacillaceae bacterium]MCL6496854.1 MFS transporter [Bacillota bacterium]
MLAVLWVGEFLIAAGTNLVIPFLPLYIEQLGVHQLAAVERWSGVVYSSTFLLSAVAQPIWGKLADRVGRKPMLIRSGMGMGIVMASLGLVHSVWQLLVLRALMGTVSGFVGAAIALQASQTPRQDAGRALGTLQTGAVSGTLVGPLIGGVLSEWVGIRNCFFFTGAAEVLAAVLVIFFVHERFRPDPEVSNLALGPFFRQLAATGIVIPLFVVTMLIQMGYLSIEPIVTIYVHLLNPHTPHLATLAGATFAAIGVGNVLSAPRLGRLADRIGSDRVLWWSLVVAAALYVPQAFVRSAYQLMALRFLLGLALGGLQPSVQALIRRHTPTTLLGRVYGFNASSMMVGNLVGPNLGGFVSAAFGIPLVFLSTAAILSLDAVWVYRAVFRAPARLPQA